MKKLVIWVLCLLVFAGTLFIFLPDDISAEAWLCYWYPRKDCEEMDGVLEVTHCNLPICNYLGPWNQICVYCKLNE